MSQVIDSELLEEWKKELTALYTLATKAKEIVEHEPFVVAALAERCSERMERLAAEIRQEAMRP